MAKLTLTDILSGYQTTTAINANNTLIENALENTLSRNGTAPNTMEVNFDMNNHRIINLGTPLVNTDAARLIDVQSAAIGLPTASTLPFTPYANIAATTIQGAIQEEVDDLGAGTGSTLVGFIQSGTGAVATTAQTKLRGLSVSVKDFGALGDGVTNDAAACQAALNTGKNVLFPAGNYYLGTANTGAFLSITTPNQVIDFEASAKLIAYGNTGVFNNAQFISIDSVSGVTINNPNGESNWSEDVARDAPNFIVLLCTTGNCNNTTIIAPRATLCQSTILAAKDDFNTIYEVNGIHVPNIYSNKNYYGITCANTGNLLTGSIYAINPHRAYFAYGCHSHTFDVFDFQDGTKATTYLNMSVIAMYSHNGSIPAKDTFGLNIRYRNYGSTYTNVKFALIAEITTGHAKVGLIYDINLHYDDRGNTTTKSIGFQHTIDGTPTAAITGTYFNRITLAGYCLNNIDLSHAGATTNIIQSVKGYGDTSGLEMGTQPTGVYDPFSGYLFDRGMKTYHVGLFDSGIAFSATQVASTNVNTLDDYEEGTFTPVCADAATAGNVATAGTSLGRYTKIGDIVWFTLSLVNVNTTGLTAGNQVYIRGLPFTVGNYAGMVFSSASGIHQAVASTTGSVIYGVNINTDYITPYNSSAAAGLSAFLVSALTSGTADFYITGNYKV
jgi:hypothetical protein